MLRAPILWCGPPRSPCSLSGPALSHKDKLSPGHQTVGGQDVGWSPGSPSRPCQVRVKVQSRLSEGILDNCNLPYQHHTGHFLLSQRATQPEKAFHCVYSCPSRADGAPPNTPVKFCQHLSPHTLLPRRPTQAAHLHRYHLGADCLWWPGKGKNEASSGHPPSPEWGRRAEQQPWAHRPRLCHQSCGTWADGTFIIGNEHLRRPHSEPGTGEPLPTRPLEPGVFLRWLHQNALKAKDSHPKYRTSWRSCVLSHTF